jgi:hypothetical protein
MAMAIERNTLGPMEAMLMSIRLGNSSRVHIGEMGRTVTAMRPQGKVNIGGRIHDARSDAFWIDSGVHIVVVNGDHLGVIVRRAEAECACEGADWGPLTPLASWQLPIERRASGSNSSANDWPRFVTGLRESACLGALYGLVCVAFGFAEAELGDWLVLRAVAAGLCGAFWGSLLFVIVRTLLRDLGEFEELTLVTLGLALFGSTGGTVAGYSLWGLIGGLTGAVLGAFALGILVPFFLVAVQAMAGPTDGDTSA